MVRIVIRLALVVALGLFVSPLASSAQQAGRVYRVAYLQTAPRTQSIHFLTALEAGLRDHGYVARRNLTLEYRFADGRLERLTELATELVRLRADVIVTGLNPVTLAVRQVTTSIPIVMALGGDPVRAGLIISLARPGGNVTGLVFDTGPEIQGKRVELPRDAVSQVRRVAVLFNPAFASRVPGAFTQVVEEAARSLGLALQSVEVRRPAEFDGAFAAMVQGRAEGLLVLGDPLVFEYRARLAGLAERYRLPTVYPLREYVDAGDLISYGVDLSDLYRRAAVHVDKILKGAKPADLPVEQPTKFELVINLKTAKALGLTIPQSLLLRADEVIQ